MHNAQRQKKMMIIIPILIAFSFFPRWCAQSFSFHSEAKAQFFSKDLHGHKDHVRLFTTSALCSTNNNDDALDRKEEEILLKFSLAVDEKYSVEEDVIPIVQRYISSFPFSAVLPVQPLTYTPKENGMGVDVAFLRKKTEEKSSKDGGIEFKIMRCDDDTSYESLPSRILIEVRRVSEGQFVSKAFSEGLLVKAFVEGLIDGDEGCGRVGIGRKELLTRCSVESMFHKWMQ
jgi:hypothetical protein